MDYKKVAVGALVVILAVGGVSYYFKVRAWRAAWIAAQVEKNAIVKKLAKAEADRARERAELQAQVEADVANIQGAADSAVGFAEQRAAAIEARRLAAVRAASDAEGRYQAEKKARESLSTEYAGFRLEFKRQADGFALTLTKNAAACDALVKRTADDLALCNTEYQKLLARGLAASAGRRFFHVTVGPSITIRPDGGLAWGLGVTIGFNVY